MAVLRFKVTRIVKPFNGEFCEVESELVSVHRDLFKNKFYQISKRELKEGDEFQEINLISRKRN